MKIAVTDANIFIDLIRLNMLAVLFAIEMEIYTTQEVIDQLNDDQTRALAAFLELAELQHINPRLPRVEITIRLQKWTELTA